jgi:hypothetical protein
MKTVQHIPDKYDIGYSEGFAKAKEHSKMFTWQGMFPRNKKNIKNDHMAGWMKGYDDAIELGRKGEI